MLLFLTSGMGGSQREKDPIIPKYLLILLKVLEAGGPRVESQEEMVWEYDCAVFSTIMSVVQVLIQ